MTARPLLGLARGCTRLCLLVGPYAVKVPNILRGWRDSLWGLLHNMAEAELAGRGWPVTCPMVAKVPGGLANVMTRARPMTEVEFALFDADAFLAGYPELGHVQAKPCSFGRLPDGRPVCLDFAP